MNEYEIGELHATGKRTKAQFQGHAEILLHP
jgi:hypothetical protein